MLNKTPLLSALVAAIALSSSLGCGGKGTPESERVVGKDAPKDAARHGELKDQKHCRHDERLIGFDLIGG